MLPPPQSSPPPSGEDPLIQAALRQIDGLPSDAPTSPSPSSLLTASAGIAPDIFPGYIVVRELHRGGQGVVYQAIQKSTKRKIAIKVMKEGPFAGPKERARFEREIEVLAQLNHPNIVTVQDSGVLPPEKGGLHYFVMDYVSGRSLDRFLEESNLAPREVLGVFAKICDAVNAAHLRGVIHRDLKPGNIRVDSNGEPHILDFGLAKIVGVHSNDTPDLMTVTGQFVGSPAWASPEQAAGDIARIDVRTDVYSIGVMMYKALTSQFPYAVVGVLREVLDNIEKALPQRPRSISRSVDDEIETILLKALSKERERRYQTAGELARDIRHYLSGEPIEAKRDSVLYMVRKAVSQRRALATTIVAVAASLVLGLVVSLVFWRGEQAQRVRAERAALQATAAREESEIARRRAEREATKAQRIADFVDEIFFSAERTLLTGVGPEPIVELLRQGDARAGAELAAEPLVQAAVLDTIGRAYLAMGRVDLADSAMERSLDLRAKAAGPDQLSPDLADSYESLSILRTFKGEHDGALRMLDKALPVRVAVHGEESIEVARTEHMIGRAHKYREALDDAEAWYTRALARAQRVAPDTLEVAEFQTSLASVAMARQQWDKAIPLLQNARAFATLRLAGEDNLPGGTIKHHLIDCYLARRETGDVRLAVGLAREVVASYERLYAPLNPRHPALVRAYSRLGRTLDADGDAAGAEGAFLKSVEAAAGDGAEPRRLRGIVLGYLAGLYERTGQAEKLAETRRQIDALR
ncbi:MAG: serine/threonine-protein kinase [Planctomycetota bacterium]|nr:serine/threonine-protein kinase [Planctomycetota bacterium]